VLSVLWVCRLLCVGERCGIVGYCVWADRCVVSGKSISWKRRIREECASLFR